MVNLLNYAFYISVALLSILCFVVAFMYLKVVKARVQYRIAKEEFEKTLAQQKAEYEDKGVNIYRASKEESNSKEDSSAATVTSTSSHTEATDSPKS